MAQYPVAFNKEQRALYDECYNKGMTSESFADFVKKAFYNRIKVLNDSFKHEDPEYIRKLAFEVSKKLGVKNPPTP